MTLFYLVVNSASCRTVECCPYLLVPQPVTTAETESWFAEESGRQTGNTDLDQVRLVANLMMAKS